MWTLIPVPLVSVIKRLDIIIIIIIVVVIVIVIVITIIILYTEPLFQCFHQ